MTKTMNLNNNLNLESESPKNPPNINQQMKNSIRLNQKLNNRREQNRKSPNISHWLLSLLDENSSAIGWTNNSREFKILDQKKLAKMWGERKGNKRMTYNNVARTMRYHYKKSKGQELEVVNKKLVYKFSQKFLASRR